MHVPEKLETEEGSEADCPCKYPVTGLLQRRGEGDKKCELEQGSQVLVKSLFALYSPVGVHTSRPVRGRAVLPGRLRGTRPEEATEEEGIDL